MEYFFLWNIICPCFDSKVKNKLDKNTNKMAFNKNLKVKMSPKRNEKLIICTHFLILIYIHQSTYLKCNSVNKIFSFFFLFYSFLKYIIGSIPVYPISFGQLKASKTARYRSNFNLFVIKIFHIFLKTLFFFSRFEVHLCFFFYLFFKYT